MVNILIIFFERILETADKVRKSLIKQIISLKNIDLFLIETGVEIQGGKFT